MQNIEEFVKKLITFYFYILLLDIKIILPFFTDVDNIDIF